MPTEDELLKDLQKQIDAEMNRINLMPNPDIDNLSPTDMQTILYDTFGTASPIAYKEIIPVAAIEEMPFMKLVLAYFEVLQEKETIKLTTRGNLPRKLCLDLYAKGFITEELIEKGISKMYKEQDSVALQNLKILNDLAGITKKRNNKVSFTAKGLKLAAPEKRVELFKEIFTTHYRKFNLGYHDGYPQAAGVQQTFGYTLYLLLRYGQEKRDFKFYGNKQIMAFPFEMGHFDGDWSTPEARYTNCLGSRIFERFLKDYGMIEVFTPQKSILLDKAALKTTPIFDSIFELRPNKFKFSKSGNFA